MNAIPPAYRPRDLGPRQVAHLKRVGWIDNRTVRKRDTAHICLPLYENGTKCWCGAKLEVPNAE